MANEQYELYQQGTAAALAEAQLALLDSKADTDGYYTMLTAGAADNLTARGDGVTASFLHRTTAGSASVPDEGKATVRSIKGRTLWWNQMIDETAFADLFTLEDGGTKTLVDHVLKISGTTTAGSNYLFARDASGTAKSVISGHKYLLCGFKEHTGGTIYVYDRGTSTQLFQILGTNAGTGAIFTAGWSTDRVDVYFNASAGSVIDLECTPQLFDLTAMFGAGNEPSTVAEFEAMFPKPYYPYDAGSLLPVRMTGVETNGFNQWDEVWELGTINATTGENQEASTGIRSKNYIPVFPSTEYYLKQPSINTNPFFYDADKNYIGRLPTYVIGSGTFTTPENARWMRFGLASAYGTTYNHDICINIHWSGYMDGTYEAHWSEQRIIAAIAENFPDGMREAGIVSDELTETVAIHPVGVGTVRSIGTVYSTDRVKYASLVGVNPDQYSSWSAMPVGATYVWSDKLGRTDGNMGITQLAIGRTWNSMYAYAPLDADDSIFDQLVGATVWYQLANPTTTTFDQPINMDYRFADFGTERILVPEGQMSAPPTMEVVYGLNAVDTLRTLPTEYVSKASDASFTAALGAFLNATITRTWDETNQRYDYTITANGGE